LATGEASMPIPESVKVTFKGEMKEHMDFRDVVHATQAQMLKQFDGENVSKVELLRFTSERFLLTKHLPSQTGLQK
jgi:aconitase B